jgi:large subunit ribosomal protein L28
MSYMCDICGKRPTVGNNVSHANNHTKRRWKPNLRKVRAVRQGSVRYIQVVPGVCTR